jgi:tRNA A-37 threonylcarbamoyl transferase component Bud32
VLRVVTAVDLAVLDGIGRLRAGTLTTVMRGADELGSPVVTRSIAWATLLLLLAFRRFQRLFVLLAVLLVGTTVTALAALEVGRIRPAGIEVLDHWDGYANPSLPVVGLGLALVGALYTLLPAGQWRNRAAWAVAAALGALSVARLYLGLDHPTDVAAALVAGVLLPAAAFRVILPDDVFPVSYRRGRRAHLDVGGQRGEAIVHALADQLGMRVSAVDPFGLGGSAGSTPVRISVESGAEAEYLFGKLYATSHLRSDRWYKLGRTVRYGRLEDERPFNTVRRLVEYEDHMLRLVRDAGLPTPQPLGVVEITPEREYLIVTEFLDGAAEIDETVVDDAVIDNALAAVRRLWQAGLAHRDIKPSNVLVRDGSVYLIDVAFGAARPTPWRQAVDLANMMLTLAVFSSAERVYERAVRCFTPDEIAEAFAATTSVTIPAQLRAALRADGRDLVTRFRDLAPPTPPVAIQRWTLRRMALTAALLLAGLAVLGLLVLDFRLVGLL